MERSSSTGRSRDNAQPWSAVFETERVKIVLAKFGLDEYRSTLLDDYQQWQGERRLTFVSFFRLFPSFPILLEARWRSRVAEYCQPATLFRDFASTFLLQDYLVVFARNREQAGERPIGMVVPFAGYRGGVIVHNGDLQTRGTRLLHEIAGDLPPHRVTVEPFVHFLAFLSRGRWSAAGGPGEELPTHKPKVKPQISLFPWMVKALDTGPGTVILAWLLGTLNSPSGYHRLYVRRLAGGERCVAANQGQIASETGLSQRQVKRGLATLRHKGLITTDRRKGRTYIWLVRDALRKAGQASP